MTIGIGLSGLGVVVLSLLAPAAGAQRASVQLALAAGSSTDQRGVRSDAVTVAPALVLANDLQRVVFSSSATRYGNGSWTLAGGLGLDARARIRGPLAFTMSGSGSATQASFGATFAAGELTPALEAAASRLAVLAGRFLLQRPERPPHRQHFLFLATWPLGHLATIDRLSFFLDFSKQIRKVIQLRRTRHEIDLRQPLEDRLLLQLRHAADDP